MNSRWILAALALCLVSSIARADGNSGTPINTGTIETRLLSAGSNWSSVEWVSFCGYHACGDGGGGLFHRETCTSDNGSCIADRTGHTFARQNFNGDIRQYGITPGSDYDCSPVANGGKGVAGCQGSSNRLSSMMTAAAAAGLSQVSLSGMQIKISSDLTLASNMTVDAEAPPYNGNQSFVDIPGTIWKDDGTHIFVGQNSALNAVNIVPTWFGTAYPLGPQTLNDNYHVLQLMTSKGDTGVTCANQSCHLTNLAIAGFDTAYDGSKANNFLNNVRADGNVCFYFHDAGSGTHWQTTNCGNDITGSNAKQGFKITAIAESSDTPGICRITIESVATGPTDNTNLETGFTMWVSGFTQTTGGSNANGRWNAVDINSPTNTIWDLPGSACDDVGGGSLDGPSRTASWLANSSILTITSGGTTNIKAGEFITGLSGSGIPENDPVLAVWPVQNIVLLKNTTTAAGGPVSVTFHGGVPAPTGSCSTSGDENVGPCAIWTTAERIDAGASPGGVAAGGTDCATGYLIGGFKNIGDGICTTGNGDKTDPDYEKVAGFDAYSPFCYAHAICYHLSNAFNCRFTSSGMDAARSLNDDDTSFALIDGSFKNCAFVGGKAGKVGSGMRIGPFDPSVTDKGCITVSFDNIGVYEVDDACLLVTGASGTPDFAFIADDASYVSLGGNLSTLKTYYQSATAQAITDTSGAIVKSGASTWGGHLEPGGFAPAISAGTGATLGAGSNDTSGTLTLGTSPTTITVTFAATWANAPSCWLFDQTDGTVFTEVTAISTTAVTFGPDFSSSAGDVFHYACFGRAN